MRNWPYFFTKFVCWLLFRLRFGLKVRGQEHVPKRGAFVLASNHVSFLDPPLMGAACPRRLRFMARADLFAKTLLGTFLRLVRVIPLKRGEADLAAVREALALLRQGEPIAIFPEGGRQLSGRLGVAKRGVGLLAEAASVPIIPVYVKGTFEALPPSAPRLQRAKIRVAFGPPISYTTTSLKGKPPSHRRHEQLAAVVTEAWCRLEAQLEA